VQIKDFFETENVAEYKCPKKLYILIPVSCNCSGKLPDNHDCISIPFDNTLEVEKDRAGKKRFYSLSVHKVTDHRDPTVISLQIYLHTRNENDR